MSNKGVQLHVERGDRGRSGQQREDERNLKKKEEKQSTEGKDQSQGRFSTTER